MKLRKYQKEDSAIICSWIKDEKGLYQQSAETLGKIPLAADDLNQGYETVMSSNRFIPFSTIDKRDNVVGHLYISYSSKADTVTVHFGYVIINPTLRGNGKCCS